MKKYLVSMAALMVLSSGAQAATYVLSSVNYSNSFAGTTPVASCTGCGVATADTTGVANSAVVLDNVSWVFSGGGNNYTTTFDATTTLAAGTSLSMTNNSCVQTLGSVCTATNVRSGLAGPNFYTGIASDNLTTCTNDRCRVDVSLSGSTLTVVIKRALSESATSTAYQSYTMSFAQVPVPAAVWLFGSALGLMGLARRKAA
ncbi:MAG: VPLPA-CTERM sorting domain-containing protein [Gammaproteobacteria bacterium]